MIEENNDWIIFHSVIIIMQTHKVQKPKNIMLYKWFRWIE